MLLQSTQSSYSYESLTDSIEGDRVGGRSLANQSESEHHDPKRLFAIGLVVVVLFASLAAALPSMAALLTRTEGAPTDIDFTFTPSNPDTGSPVSFAGIASDPDGDPLSFSWDFGDGYSAVGQTVSHQFVNGTSNVTMLVDDGEIGPEPRPLTVTKMVVVTENSPPTISVPSNPAVIVLKATMFTVAYTDNDSGDSHRFTWFWGDGGSIVTSIPQAEHVYALNGNYNFEVYCDDLTGLQGHNVSGKGFNTVLAPCCKPPIIRSFYVDSATVLVSEPVMFTCEMADYGGDILGFTFEFGDGSFAYGNVSPMPINVTVNVSHSYSASGSYDAWVYITDYIRAPVCAGPVSILVEEIFSLNLSQGWNLVCLPLVGHDYKSSNLGLARGDVVVGPWNPIIQSYSGTYIVGIYPPISDFKIVPGLGYWIFVSVSRTLQTLGVQPTGTVTFNITVPVGGGWALMGFLGLKTHNASNVVPLFSSGVGTVAKYQPHLYHYMTYVVGVPPTDFPIYPGEAFFMYCHSSGSFSYIL
jgi:PKD repeat protein